MNTTEAYKKLLRFCVANGFKVKENTDKFYSLEATKSSFLFWTNTRLKLEILTVGKTQVSVMVQVFRLRMRQPKLEHQYILAIEKYFELDN